MSTYETRVTLKAIKQEVSKSDSAIKEAIANAIDANSKNIYIDIYEQKLGNRAVDVSYFCLDIVDDGEGLPSSEKEFEEAFCRYRESPKGDKSQYGKRGKGRYTYLTVVNDTKNINIYSKDKYNQIFYIYFDCKEGQNVKIGREKYTDKVSLQRKVDFTTIVQFENLNIKKFELKEQSKEELNQYIRNDIIAFFADRIGSGSINIYLNGALLNINDYLQKNIISEIINIKEQKFEVDFYIWNEKVKLKSDRQKHILFFDESKQLKFILPSGKHKIAFNGYSRDHSIVVKSKYFNNMEYMDNLFTDEIVLNLKKQIEFELEIILEQIYKENINKISADYIGFLEREQDEITQEVYHALLLPFVSKFGNKSIQKDIKSIIVKLIDTLIKESPDSYINNLNTILDLNDKESEQIDYIQDNYGIISAVAEKEKIIERIDFLNKFDDLVNGSNRKSVKERTQLHKVIEKNLWLISEEFDDITYQDIFSDKSIQTILENSDFYQFDSTSLVTLLQTENVSKIPDIFIPLKKSNIIYVIELKKPTVKINRTILDEIEDKYTKTFKNIQKKSGNSNTKIHAYAISDDRTNDVLARGDLDSGLRIEVKCWTELIETARDRCNKMIIGLDNKLKKSKWETFDEFVDMHRNQ